MIIKILKAEFTDKRRDGNSLDVKLWSDEKNIVKKFIPRKIKNKVANFFGESA
jgi:hypothetical protein